MFQESEERVFESWTVYTSNYKDRIVIDMYAVAKAFQALHTTKASVNWHQIPWPSGVLANALWADIAFLGQFCHNLIKKVNY